jgi:hypothetical protein
MPDPIQARWAILYPGNRAARDRSDPAQSRFASLFSALADAGVAVEPAVYNDDFSAEVEQQLQRLHGVLVWHNPIEGGRTRRVLDDMLRRVADHGVRVSAHPDTILRMGTKDVLVAVRDLPFGSDAHHVGSLEQLAAELPTRLAAGPRVLKQHRGHSGIGVWRVQAAAASRYAVRHAQRGASEETLDLASLCDRLAPYFDDGGHMVDQAWQPRLVEGMTRAYLVGDRVAGFGHQAVIALVPAAEPGGAPPAPGPRLYSGADDPRFQALRQRLEHSWVNLLCERLGVAKDRLPLLWDADFFLGESTAIGGVHHVLCEINVSSVSPFPDAAIPTLVAAVLAPQLVA